MRRILCWLGRHEWMWIGSRDLYGNRILQCGRHDCFTYKVEWEQSRVDKFRKELYSNWGKTKEAIECMQNLITPQGGKQLNEYGWDYERSHKTALKALKVMEWIEKQPKINDIFMQRELLAKFNEED